MAVCTSLLPLLRVTLLYTIAGGAVYRAEGRLGRSKTNIGSGAREDCVVDLFPVDFRVVEHLEGFLNPYG